MLVKGITYSGASKALTEAKSAKDRLQRTSESAPMSELGMLTMITGKMVPLLTVRQSGQSGPEKA